MSKCSCWSHNGFVLKEALSPEGLAQRMVDKGLTPRGVGDIVDKSVSVSALVEVEDDFDYDPRHVELNRRLIHHGT